ncbi:MAG: hypothetical protein HY925_00370 [Elusimicrobia bacterium]|nr:hypothetical protein [Elusimicrobiota bacterium]
MSLFPTRLCRGRIEARHFFGPTLTALDDRWDTSATIYSFGLMTAW